MLSEAEDQAVRLAGNFEESGERGLALLNVIVEGYRAGFHVGE